MRRRDFIRVIALSVVNWPLLVRAQGPAIPIVGFLHGGSAWEFARMAEAFRQGLSERGYTEGQNVFLEYRWAEGHYDRLPIMAAELARRQVTVMFAATAPASLAAKAATTTIPVVFWTGSDPVALGLVASLGRPGGNITGVATLAEEVDPKRLEVLHKLVPAVTVIGAFVNSASPIAETQTKDFKAAARRLGLQIHVLNISGERDFGPAFTTLIQMGASALIIGADAFFMSQNEQLVALAARHTIPTIYFRREFVAAGGLISYGSSLPESYREAGNYVARILKGEMPADLPVVEPTKIELAINRKTARTLGLTIPQDLLVAADEVIE
jgi:putative tryptophan/tyrosine transport system substrate-binding protein